MKKITFQFSERGRFIYVDSAAAGAKCIDYLFASLGHLPSLRVLCGPYGSWLSWDNVFERCPILAYIYGTVLPLEVLRTRSPVPIRACHLEAPWCDIIPCLDDLICLEGLEWYPESDTDVDIRGKHGSLPALPALWRVLSNNVQSPNMLTLLKLTKRLTQLRLRIEDNWQHFYDFFLLLEDLCHLRDLQLDLSYIEGKFSFPINRLAKTGVKSLQVFGPFTGNFGPVTTGRDTAVINQETIFSTFSICFPEVARLELFYTFLGPKVAMYIQSATRLLSLTLVHDSVGTLPEYHGAPIKSLTLEVLNLSVGLDATLNIFNPIIECPSVLKLTLKDVPTGQGEWSAPQIQHKVEHLHITSPIPHVKILRFTALRKLQISQSFFDDMTGSEVLILFICEPTICPLLSELRLDSIPEWDLLFLMLERRNYLPQSRHVSRIKILTLLLPPPPRLLVPLTEILAGRFTVRPPNEDISVSSLREGYFDPNMCALTFRLVTEVSLIIFCS